MGGKRLKFPKRKKFVSKEGEITLQIEETVSEEEKQKRIEHLRSLGLIK